MNQFRCRFYEEPYPGLNDVVMVTVKSVEESGAYVELLEYANVEGMMPVGELSRRQIRSVHQLVKVGRAEIGLVIRVDREKGYVDLSKRRVSAEELTACEKKFKRAKTVHQILRHVASSMKFTSNEQFEKLYYKTAWQFDRKAKRKGACYDSFKLALSKPELLDTCDIDETTKVCLLSAIKRRMVPDIIKLRADIEVSCYNYHGVDAVKTALREGLKYNRPNQPVKINLLAPPVYLVTTETADVVEGRSILSNALADIQKSIERQKGIYRLHSQIRIVSNAEELSLQRKLDELEEVNSEICGDYDDQDDGLDDESASETSSILNDLENLTHGFIDF